MNKVKLTAKIKKALIAVRDRLPYRGSGIIDAVNANLIVWDDNITDRNIMGEYRLTEEGKNLLS